MILARRSPVWKQLAYLLYNIFNEGHFSAFSMCSRAVVAKRTVHPLGSPLGSAWVGGLAVILFVLAGEPCRAQAGPAAGPTTAYSGTLTLTGGVGAPYGCGLDYGRLVVRNLEATVGAGYDLSGFKAGIGARYYLWGAAREAKFATFVGANVSYCAGRGSLALLTHEDHLYFRDDTAQIRIRSCVVGRLRAGLHWQPGARLGLTTALGYGLVLGPDPVQYLSSAYPTEGMRAVVATRRPNSLELSLALSLRIGHLAVR